MIKWLVYILLILAITFGILLIPGCRNRPLVPETKVLISPAASPVVPPASSQNPSGRAFGPRGLAQATNLDYIDAHVYPLNNDFFERAVTAADIAVAPGKKFVIGESWLYKVSDSELGKTSAMATQSEIFARDAVTLANQDAVKSMLQDKLSPLGTKYKELIGQK